MKIFPGLKWIGLGARTWPVVALQTTWPGLDAGEWVVVDHDLQFAVVCGRPYSGIVGGRIIEMELQGSWRAMRWVMRWAMVRAMTTTKLFVNTKEDQHRPHDQSHSVQRDFAAHDPNGLPPLSISISLAYFSSLLILSSFITFSFASSSSFDEVLGVDF